MNLKILILIVRAAIALARSTLHLAGASVSDLNQVPEVNSTLSDLLLDCLLLSWDCDLFASVASSERQDIAGLNSIAASLTGDVMTQPSPSPPSYYTGVFSPRSGQPVVIHDDTMQAR